MYTNLQNAEIKIYNQFVTFREKNDSRCQNIIGVFLDALGCLDHVMPFPCPELPNIHSTLKYKIGIQPSSVWAANPPITYIQRIVDICKAYSGQDVVAIGNKSTPRNLNNVDYSFLRDDALFFLSCINQLGLLLTPRSASAVAAAGYMTPSIMWLPRDGENWIANFNGWPVLKLDYQETLREDCIITIIKQLIKIGRLKQSRHNNIKFI